MRFRRGPSDPKIERLSRLRLFSACSRDELARIAALSTEVEVPPGRALTREGEPGHECFLIEEGTATAALPGREPIRMGPGEVVGELALLHDAPRAATVTAETDMRLVVIDSREFATLLDDVPSVARSVLEAVAERIREVEAPQPHH